jgi:hypothetical protein
LIRIIFLSTKKVTGIVPLLVTRDDSGKKFVESPIA